MQAFIEKLPEMIVGGFIGGIFSFMVSYLFFLRGKRHESATDWLSHNLSKSMSRLLYSAFFDALAVRVNPVQPSPANPDIPRLDEVYFLTPSTHPGGQLEILCRVVDMGMNFPSMSGGLEIIDHLGTRYPVSGEVFGYMRATIPVASSQPCGTYALTFEMHDIDTATWQPKNRFNQTVPFIVA